jgi:hypothetical protein
MAEPEMPATTPRIEKIPAPIMAPTPILRAATSPISDCFAESALGSLLRRTLFTVVEHLGSQAAHSQNESQQNAVI